MRSTTPPSVAATLLGSALLLVEPTARARADLDRAATDISNQPRTRPRGAAPPPNATAAAAEPTRWWPACPPAPDGPRCRLRRRPRRSAPPVAPRRSAGRPRAGGAGRRGAARRFQHWKLSCARPTTTSSSFRTAACRTDGYLFRYTGDKNRAKSPTTPSSSSRARLELGGLGRDRLSTSGSAQTSRSAACLAAPVAHVADEPRTRRTTSSRSRPGKSGDPPVRPIRCPVHAREPDLGQVLRLHRALAHGARLRHPHNKERAPCSTGQRRPQLLLLVRRGQRRRQNYRERRRQLRRDGAGLGRAALVHRARARCTTWTIGGSYWTENGRTRFGLPTSRTRRRQAGLHNSQHESVHQAPTTDAHRSRCGSGPDERLGRRDEHSLRPQVRRALGVRWTEQPAVGGDHRQSGAGTIAGPPTSRAIPSTVRPGMGCWATIASSAISRGWSRSSATRSSACGRSRTA